MIDIRGLAERVGLKKTIKKLSPAVRRLRRWRNSMGGLKANRADIDLLYRLLYDAVHDLDRSLPITKTQTETAFASQWEHLPKGRFLLSDPVFRDNITDIITNEELLLKPEWFKDKRVLDAGCGNGRWAFGLAKLGVNLTAVDVNSVAIEEAKRAQEDINITKRFKVSSLEDINQNLSGEKFDLVWSWGVVHHCHSFNRSLENLCDLVCDGGVLFLYLYGRESLAMDEDVALFKERLRYNSLSSAKEKMAFLTKKARGKMDQIHVVHDIYAPLINRRLDFEYVEGFLRKRGFGVIERTKDHPEIWIRAVKAESDEAIAPYKLPYPQSPFWFER